MRPPPIAGDSRVERYLQSPANTVNASDAVDEMLDELAADIAKLGTSIAPILVVRVDVSSNIAPSFAPLLEARLINAIRRASPSLVVARCLECESAFAHVENETWIVARGLTSLEKLQSVGAKYGARSILSASLSLQGAAEGLALDVQLIRPESAAVLFSEGYRFSPGTVALYRGADTAQHRAEKLKELEARLDGHPSYGYGFQAGMLFVPLVAEQTSLKTVGGYAPGFVGSFRLYERFGTEKQFRAGFDVGAYVDTAALAAGMFSGSLSGQVTPSSAWLPALSLGGSVGGFITGTVGNAPFFALNVEAFFIHRIGFQITLMYLLPFTATAVGKVGGFCPGGSLEVAW